MTVLRLRFRDRDVDLVDGQFVIGRAASCQISLDDPMVSRSHATLLVQGNRVVLEDLGSRNGVSVNGQRVTGSRQLEPGDQITVGSQQLQLLAQDEPEAAVSRGAPTQRFDRYDVIGGLVDKALALGRGEEAERLLERLLLDSLADARAGRASASVDQAGLYAARMIGVTGRSAHFDYVVDLYQALGRLPPVAVVDALYEGQRQLAGVELGKFRRYLAGLRDNPEPMSPAQRFVFGRLEGLGRALGAR